MLKAKHKRAVVTVAIGRKTESIAEVTHPIMRRYAERIGGDFVVIRDHVVNSRYPQFEKFQIHDLLGAYDRIVYLDTDIIVMPDCPDLFDVVPRVKFGAFFDSEVKNNDADIPKWRDDEIRYFQKKYGDINWSSRYFNTGVMVISRSHREILNYRNPVHRGKRFIDQTQINYNFQKLQPASFDLGPRFNYLLALNRSKAQFDGRFDNHILHYAGFDYFYKGRSLLRRIRLDAAAACPRGPLISRR